MPESKQVIGKPSTPYTPIDTDVVDNLHHYSSDHIHVHLAITDGDGSPRELRGYIADVYTTKDHEEYLRLEDGRELRLDQIKSVEPLTHNGKEARLLEEKLGIEGSQFFPNATPPA